MPVSIVQGKLGTGKGKFVVGKIQEALQQGRRVATNCDLFMEHLVHSQSKITAVRLPDKPTADDLAAIGKGYDGKIDPKRDGILVLDELGSWLNARSFQDKGRAGFLDWLIHARKHRWTTYLVAQDMEMIDSQVRKAVCEFSIRCVNLERMKIPIIGNALGPLGKLPRLHVAVTSLTEIQGIKVDREFFRGDHLHDAYDTEQVFRNWARDPADLGFESEQMAGPFSYLSAWHLKGRFEKIVVKKRGFIASMFSPRYAPKIKPKLPQIERLAGLAPADAWAAARAMAMELSS